MADWLAGWSSLCLQNHHHLEIFQRISSTSRSAGGPSTLFKAPVFVYFPFWDVCPPIYYAPRKLHLNPPLVHSHCSSFVSLARLTQPNPTQGVWFLSYKETSPAGSLPGSPGWSPDSTSFHRVTHSAWWSESVLIYWRNDQDDNIIPTSSSSSAARLLLYSLYKS